MFRAWGRIKKMLSNNVRVMDLASLIGIFGLDTDFRHPR